MPAIRAQRVPLATGATSFRGIFICSPGAAIVGLAAGYVAHHAHAADDRVALPIGVFGFVALVYALIAIYLSVRFRATDIDLSPTGFTVVGGPWTETSAQWSSIDSTTVRLDAGKLTVGEQVLADTSAPHDRESLEVIAQAIINASSPPVATPFAEPELAILKCSACGAVVVPVDRDEVACRSCGVTIALPLKLRERIRAARELDADSRSLRRLAEKLARRPSAARTNVALLASGAFFLVSVALAVFGVEVGWPSAVLVAVALSLPLLVFARMDIADRIGAVALAMGSAARSPEKPGDPYACRVCGAPLPPAEAGAIVVRCGYCNADNVLGIDLRIDAGATRWKEGSFAIAARHRGRGRIARVVALVAAVGLLGVAWQRRGVKSANDQPDTYDCLHGSDAACLDYCERSPPASTTELTRSLVRAHSYDRVLRLWKALCVQDKNTMYCDDATRALMHGGHVPRDEGAAVTLAIDACNAGVVASCRDAAGALARGFHVPRDVARATSLFQRACDANVEGACACVKDALEPGCSLWELPFDEPDDFNLK